MSVFSDTNHLSNHHKNSLIFKFFLLYKALKYSDNDCYLTIAGTQQALAMFVILIKSFQEKQSQLVQPLALYWLWIGAGNFEVSATQIQLVDFSVWPSSFHHQSFQS